MKTALVIGLENQHSFYLISSLLKKGYFVHGLENKKSILFKPFTGNSFSLTQNQANYKSYFIDLLNSNYVLSLIKLIQPQEIYNLSSLNLPSLHFNNIMGSLNATVQIVAFLRLSNLKSDIKLFHAHCFCYTEQSKQAYQNINNYGASYEFNDIDSLIQKFKHIEKLFVCFGLINNWPRKVLEDVVKLCLGLHHTFFVDDLSIEKYWVDDQFIAESMWLSVQQNFIQDCILESGLKLTVRELIRRTFTELGVEIEFSGKGIYEKAVVIDIDEDLITKFGLDDRYLKPGQTVVKMNTNVGNGIEQHCSAQIVKEKLSCTLADDLNNQINKEIVSTLYQYKRNQYLKNFIPKP